MTLRALLASGALALVACSSGPDPLPQPLVVDEADVSPVGQVVGLTWDADLEAWVALNDRGELHEAAALDGPWSLVARFDAELHDVVAVGPGVYALSAPSDGFLYDRGEGVLRQHFCYEPAIGGVREEPVPPQDEPVFELSRSLAYDADTGRIVAQPVSIGVESGRAVFSEVAWFDVTSGTELRFVDLADPTLATGAMAMLDGGRLVAGAGAVVLEIDSEDAATTSRWDLSAHGVEAVTAMALRDGRLWVVDGARGRAIALDAARL